MVSSETPDKRQGLCVSLGIVELTNHGARRRPGCPRRGRWILALKLVKTALMSCIRLIALGENRRRPLLAFSRLRRHLG